MHAMGDVIDMRRFSGLRHVLPITHWTFLCGAGALSGFPIIFSGFWSKDDILAVSFQARHATRYGDVYLVLFILALLTAGLTAFYTARAYFMTFWGEVKIPPEAFSHAHGGDTHTADGHDAHAVPSPTSELAAPHGQVHESPPVMTYPLMVLAAGAVFAGIVLGPTHLFERFLENHWMEPAFPHAIQAPEGMDSPFNWGVMLLSSAFALIGIGVAWWMYVRVPALPAQLARALATAYELSRNKFYLDELYEAFIVGPMTALAHVLRIFDQYILDGIVDLIGQLPAYIGFLLRPAQNGLVQFYALLMALGVAGFVVAVLLR
jgi:NADH-quinone oxidoreductase subunit L